MMMTKFWSSFSAAPHRVMFFGGALQALLVMLWWLVELATRFGILGQPVSWAIMPVASHAYLMIYGLFPFFMFGFLMTVFPRWMGGREVPSQLYIPAFLLLMLGIVVFYAGLLSNKTLLAVAAMCTLAGWLIALYALLRVLLDTNHPDKKHPAAIFIALGAGWCGLASWLIWILSDQEAYLRIVIQGGIWLFLLPVFASVAHRMLPFFTSSALPLQEVKRPDWPWWLLLAGSVLHCLLQLADLPGWQWLGDLPMAVAVFNLSLSWRFAHALRNPMLGVLHIAFAWMGIAMLLFTIQSVMFLVGDRATPVWGLAPLHALTIGCFATMLIGFGTRVTLGHSGLPMQADKPMLLMFAGIQLAALLRVLADMLPIQGGYWLYVVAAAFWLISLAPWVLRYVPVYLRPRVDGQAG